MPKHDDTALPADLLRLLAERAGRPALGRREPDNAPVYALLAIEARRLMLQAQRAVDAFTAAAVEARKPPRCGARRCGNLIEVKPTGRPAEYCSEPCRVAERRARGMRRPVPRETSAVSGQPLLEFPDADSALTQDQTLRAE